MNRLARSARHHLRPVVVVVVGLCSAAVLGACGSDGPAETAEPAPSATVTVTAPAAIPTPSVEPTPTPVESDTPAPADEPTVPEGLLPRDETEYTGNGDPITFANGTTVTADVRRVTITGPDGATSRGRLPSEAESGVGSVPVEFAQAGTGYLVSQSGGEFSDLSVVLPLGGKAVVASEPEDVPFGYVGDEIDGTTVETWTIGEGSGLITRIRVGQGESLSENRYRVYSWEVIIGADGSGDTAELVPSNLGIACFDDEADTYQSC